MRRTPSTPAALRFLALCATAFATLLAARAQDPFRVKTDLPYAANADVAAGLLEDGDRLGTSLLRLEGFPLVGGPVLAAGLRGRDDGARVNTGAVALSALQPDGTLDRLGLLDAALLPTLGEDHSFGNALASPGDLDGDGVPELLVGAPFDSVLGQADVGAVYVIFLDSAAGFRRAVRLTNGDGGLPVTAIAPASRFGTAVAAIDDLDGDGRREVLVGAPYDQSGGTLTGGALYVLFLNADGTLRTGRKVDPVTDPILAPRIADGDFFGCALAHLGPFGGAGNGVTAVGAYGADGTGRVHLLRFTDGGFVNRNVEIGPFSAALSGELEPADAFGFALANAGDLDGDGLPELAVTAPGDDDADDGISDRGAAWILHLDALGAVRERAKISATRGGFESAVQPADFFGSAIAAAGDLDGDGLPDLLIGARNATRAGVNTGTFHFVTSRYCRPAGALTVDYPMAGEVRLSWDPVPLGLGYLLQFRPAGTLPWFFDTLTTGTVWGNDTLDPGETYDWRVFSACGDRTFSNASSSAAFTVPLPRSGGLALAGADRIRLPADFAAGETLSCHTVDGRLLGTAVPGPGPALWTLPAAWRGPALRFVRRGSGDALALPPSR